MTQAEVRRPRCLRIIYKSLCCPAPAGLGPTRQVSQVCEKVFMTRSPVGWLLKLLREPRLSQAVGILHLSVDLLQVLRPKGGRQQLLDSPENIGTIRLGQVDSPVGAKLSHDLPAGPTG